MRSPPTWPSFPPGSFSKAPSDDVLEDFRVIAGLALASNIDRLHVPPEAWLCLINELMVLRARFRQAVPNEPDKPDQPATSIIERPSDTQLKNLARLFTEEVRINGPLYEVSFPVLALGVLVDELIEFRKMPKA